MKIVIIGANGFAGSEFVLRLIDAGADVLLAGRDKESLSARFPGQSVCDCANISVSGKGHDLLIHVAMENDGFGLADEAAQNISADFANNVGKLAEAAGIKRLIILSSVSVLNRRDAHAEPQCEAETAAALAALHGVEVLTVYLPTVYGSGWTGSLAILNRLPKGLAKALFQMLSAFFPVVHVSKLVDFAMAPHPGRAGEATILFDDKDSNGVFRAVKRIADIVFAATVLVAFWWLLLVIWALVRLETPGPGLFSQDRVGRGGRVFTCYKFRTMRLGTVQAGTHEVPLSAITRVGAVLRKTKLDELPQIINIIRNEITLVGPRPGLPVQKDLVLAREQRGVLSMKPGASGYAQVRGVDMSNPVRLACFDARYKALRSLSADFNIVARTFKLLMQGGRS